MKELIIRSKKLGASKVEIGGMGTINYIDYRLLTSMNGQNGYKRILETD